MAKKYYFVFCKEDLLLEKTATGGYTIPFQEEPPTVVKPWTNLMNITPMEDGSEVKTYRIDAPVTDDARYEMCGLRQSYYKLESRNCSIGIRTRSIAVYAVHRCGWIQTSLRNARNAVRKSGHSWQRQSSC